jgi:hypothetical protein
VNWYRIILRESTGREHTREVQAHGIADAIAIAMIKSGTQNGDNEVRVHDADCIDTPGWAQNAVRAAAKAVAP